MINDKFLKQLGLGVASLTFGVALSIFIFVAISGLLITMPAILLYIISFLLMLRFWWRYTELFVRFLPSRNYAHFLFDFIISFFGIIAVLFISNIQVWSLIGMAAMAASVIRCGLSWKDAKKHNIKKMLKSTVLGAVVMGVVFTVVYTISPIVNNLYLAGGLLVLVVIFIAYASREK